MLGTTVFEQFVSSHRASHSCLRRSSRWEMRPFVKQETRPFVLGSYLNCVSISRTCGGNIILSLSLLKISLSIPCLRVIAHFHYILVSHPWSLSVGPCIYFYICVSLSLNLFIRLSISLFLFLFLFYLYLSSSPRFPSHSLFVPLSLSLYNAAQCSVVLGDITRRWTPTKTPVLKCYGRLTSARPERGPEWEILTYLIRPFPLLYPGLLWQEL